MKELVLCDKQVYYIAESDYEILRRLSPGLARMVRDSDSTSATHFVCEHCGQICPLKLRKLHVCRHWAQRRSC